MRHFELLFFKSGCKDNFCISKLTTFELKKFYKILKRAFSIKNRAFLHLIFSKY